MKATILFITQILVAIFFTFACSEKNNRSIIPPPNAIKINNDYISGKVVIDGYYFKPTGTIDIDVSLKINSSKEQGLSIIYSIVHPKSNSIILSNESQFKTESLFNQKIKNIFDDKPLLMGKYKLEFKIYLENKEVFRGFTNIQIRVEIPPSYEF